MFTTVYNLERLINQNLQYLTEGVASGKADEDYIESMEDLLDRQLKRLKEISCNDELIKRMTDKVYKTFDEIKED